MTFLMISLLRNSQELKIEDVATLCGWMTSWLHISSSSGSSTPPSYSLGTSTRPSYSPESSRSAQNLGKAECSNCKFLAEKIKTLEAEKITRDGKASRETHT
ncbi:hypothetical protein Tco_0080797 [Tanacetum coccineum]